MIASTTTPGPAKANIGNKVYRRLFGSSEAVEAGNVEAIMGAMHMGYFIYRRSDRPGASRTGIE